MYKKTHTSFSSFHFIFEIGTKNSFRKHSQPNLQLSKKILMGWQHCGTGRKNKKKNSLLKKQNHSIFYSFEVKQSHKIFILGIRSQL